MEFSILGKATETVTEPSSSVLDKFPNRNKENSYLVKFDLEDFTSLCPVTGQPDFAKIRISYIPNELCVETKSLKYYLHSYRNTKSFNEAIVNQMLDHLVEVLDPKWIRVSGEFVPRGGIALTTICEHPKCGIDELKKQA